MRRSALLLLLLAAGGALSGAALPGLRFDHDTRSLQRADAVADAREEELAATFGSEDILLLAWEVRDALDPAEFARLGEVTRALEAVEGLDEVYSIASKKLLLGLPGGPRPLAARDFETEESRAAARQALRASPVYLGTVYNEALDVVAVASTIRPGPRAERHATLERVAAIAREQGEEVHVAGVTALAVEAGRYALRDLRRIGLLALIASLFVLFWVCGSVRETLVVATATALPPLYALGFAAAVDIPITALGAALFPVLAVVGITTGIHLLHAYGEEVARGRGAAARAARRLAPPIVLSLGTTAAAFFSLQATGVPAFRSGGAVVGAGVLVAIPVMLLGVPAALSLLRPPVRRRHRRFLRRPLLAVLAGVLRRRRVVLAAGAAVCVAGVLLALRAPVQVDVLQSFRPESRIARTYRFLDERLTATLPVDAVLEARADATDEEVLVDLERFSNRVVALPGVESALSLATLVNYGRSLTVDLGPAPALAFLRWKFERETRRFEHRETRRYRIKIRVREGTPVSVLESMREAAHGFETGEARLTGLYVRAVGTTRHLLGDLARGTALMVTVVVLTVMLALRSPRFGIAALLPNLLPPAVVFGGAALLGGAFDVSAVAAGAVAVGLAIDDTLHYLFRYAGERRRRPSPAALRRTQRSVGRAIVLSTLVLAAGLWSLRASAFLPTARFGALTATSVVVALLADLLLLPALLRALE